MSDTEIHGVQPHNGLSMMRAGLKDIDFEYRGYRFVDATDADHGFVYLLVDDDREPSRVIASCPTEEFEHWETTAKAREFVDRLLDTYESRLEDNTEDA